jgi:hypothetical protein
MTTRRHNQKWESRVAGCEGGSQAEKMQLTGSKREWLVYTRLCSGIQNGNPRFYAFGYHPALSKDEGHLSATC